MYLNLKNNSYIIGSCLVLQYVLYSRLGFFVCQGIVKLEVYYLQLKLLNYFYVSDAKNKKSHVIQALFSEAKLSHVKLSIWSGHVIPKSVYN
jgi:hypothetical protein